MGTPPPTPRAGASFSTAPPRPHALPDEFQMALQAGDSLHAEIRPVLPAAPAAPLFAAAPPHEHGHGHGDALHSVSLDVLQQQHTQLTSAPSLTSTLVTAVSELVGGVVAAIGAVASALASLVRPRSNTRSAPAAEGGV